MDVRTLVVFLLLFTLLVFVHELGHFITARLMGMRVLEFGFGFPPRAFRFRRGGIDYSINWIPFGGFVRILGEDGTTRTPDGRPVPDAFASKPVPARAFVLVAGVLMNVILAFVVYTSIFATGEPTFNGKVQWQLVEPGSPAALAGLRDNDVITRIDGKTFVSPDDMTRYIYGHVGKEIAISVERDGTPIGDVVATPRESPPAPIRCKRPGYETQGPLGLCDAVPIRELVAHPPLEAVGLGADKTWVTLKEIVVAFSRTITALISGRGGAGDVAGPIGIFNLTGQVVQLGPAITLELLALLSLNLAILNIVPFPGLDGGRLLFVLIEGLRGGKRLDPRTEAAIHAAGFVMLLFLVFLVSFFDIRRLAGG